MTKKKKKNRSKKSSSRQQQQQNQPYHHHHRNRQGNTNNHHTTTTNNNNNHHHHHSNTNTNHHNHTLLQRLRHGDRHTRHAALSALLHATSCRRRIQPPQDDDDNEKKNRLCWLLSSSSWSERMDWMRVIREQVMPDTDLDCAVMAAGCLVHLLMLSSQPSNENQIIVMNEDEEDNHHQWEEEQAGWILVLVARLQHAQSMVVAVEATGTNNPAAALDSSASSSVTTMSSSTSSSSSSAYYLWLSLAERCSHALVLLLEESPHVLSRLQESDHGSGSSSSSSSSSSKNGRSSSNSTWSALGRDCFQTLLFWLEWATTKTVMTTTMKEKKNQKQQKDPAVDGMEATATTTKTTTTTPTNEQGNDEDDRATLVASLAVWTARAFHSMLEDNVDLVLPLFQTVVTSPPAESFLGQRLVHLLQSILVMMIPSDESGGGRSSSSSSTISTTFTTLSSTTLTTVQLHCAGTWISLWQQLSRWSSSLSSDSAATDRIAVLQSGMAPALALVSQVLLQYAASSSVTTGDSAGQQQQLPILLLHQQLQTNYQAYVDQVRDNALEQQVVREQKKKGESARAIARRIQQEEKAKKQAAAAATTTTAQKGAGDTPMTEHHKDEEEEEDKRGRLPEDRRDRQELWEDSWHAWNQQVQRPLQLALEIIANVTATASSCSGRAIQACDDDDDDDDCKMKDEEDEAATLAVSQALAAFLVEHQIPDRLLALLGWVFSLSSVPPPVVESMDDLQGKLALCVGHCMAIPQWPVHSGATIWQDLQTSFERAVGPSGRQGVSMAMVLALRHRPVIRTSLQAAQLEFIFGLLSLAEHPHDDDDADATAVMVRDAVCMLGILCQEEHSAQVNERVCQALLQVLQPDRNQNKQSTPRKAHPMIMAEVLNVLMDMYSEDDCFDTFYTLNVLKHFETSVPKFQRLIREASQSPKVEPADLEEWQESALNAERFIQYKKQLR